MSHKCTHTPEKPKNGCNGVAYHKFGDMSKCQKEFIDSHPIEPQKVLTLKKLLKVVNPIKKSAPDSYPTGKPKYPDAYSKLSTMKPSPQKKVKKKKAWAVVTLRGKLIGHMIFQKEEGDFQTVYPVDVFLHRSQAKIKHSWIVHKSEYKVVPCIISYTLPSVNKKNKS